MIANLSGFVDVNFGISWSNGLTIRVGPFIRARRSLVESWRVEGGFNRKISVTSGPFRIRP